MCTVVDTGCCTNYTDHSDANVGVIVGRDGHEDRGVGMVWTVGGKESAVRGEERCRLQYRMKVLMRDSTLIAAQLL
jgi:hypothetical protein